MRELRTLFYLAVLLSLAFVHGHVQGRKPDLGVTITFHSGTAKIINIPWSKLDDQDQAVLEKLYQKYERTCNTTAFVP